MPDTNQANANPDGHWHALNDTAAQIPDAPMPNPNDIDWEEFGEYDWHYTVATGHFGDDQPETETARHHRDRIRAHLEHLDATQLGAYINGFHTGIDSFMWFGL